MPIDATGVSVSIDAVDPNGNNVHIGDAVSDISGTFNFLWEPEIAGEYHIMATFTGSASYGSSYATTAVGVVNAPESTPLPTTSQLTQEQYTTIDLVIVAAVIVAILIGLVNLRRH
jgi:hypothetical protein